jgi:hypothetical protein
LTYHSADLVEFPKIDMLSRINWENSSISLSFLTGRSLISSSNFERVATSANLNSLVEKLDNRDERSSLMVQLLPSSFVYLTSLHLMPLYLSQLIWYSGNMVDDLGLPRRSFWADLTIVDNYDIVEAFINDKVLVNVDTTDATDMVGEEGNTFLWMLRKKQLRALGLLANLKETCKVK